MSLPVCATAGPVIPLRPAIATKAAAIIRNNRRASEIRQGMITSTMSSRPECVRPVPRRASSTPRRRELVQRRRIIRTIPDIPRTRRTANPSRLTVTAGYTEVRTSPQAMEGTPCGRSPGNGCCGTGTAALHNYPNRWHVSRICWFGTVSDRQSLCRERDPCRTTSHRDAPRDHRWEP